MSALVRLLWREFWRRCREGFAKFLCFDLQVSQCTLILSVGVCCFSVYFFNSINLSEVCALDDALPDARR